MKKLLVGLSFIFISTIARADTFNQYWYNESVLHAQTSCQTGGDINLPVTAPTKYGYDFIGWEKLSYTPLQYIESTGTQWIDTGIRATTGLNIEITVKLKSYEISIFGSRLIVDNTSTNALMFSAKQVRTLWLYGDSTQHNWLPVISLNAWHKIQTIGGAYYLDDEFVAKYSNQTIPNGQNIFLFAANNVGDLNIPIAMSENLQISSFKISDSNNNLVRDMVPVLDISSTPCMLDKVSGQFFYNQGTGDFIAGPEIGDLQ